MHECVCAYSIAVIFVNRSWIFSKLVRHIHVFGVRVRVRAQASALCGNDWNFHWNFDHCKCQWMLSSIHDHTCAIQCAAYNQSFYHWNWLNHLTTTDHSALIQIDPVTNFKDELKLSIDPLPIRLENTSYRKLLNYLNSLEFSEPKSDLYLPIFEILSQYNLRIFAGTLFQLSAFTELPFSSLRFFVFKCVPKLRNDVSPIWAAVSC